VNWTLEEALDRGPVEVNEFVGEGEQVPHPDTDEDLAFAVLAGACLEVAPDLAELVVGLEGVEPFHEAGGGEYGEPAGSGFALATITGALAIGGAHPHLAVISAGRSPRARRSGRRGRPR
jgi:hypothetical protein